MKLNAYYIERRTFSGTVDGLVMIFERDAMADTRAEMVVRDMMRGNNYIEWIILYTDTRTIAEYQRKTQMAAYETLYPE